jgi:hypothetical protein
MCTVLLPPGVNPIAVKYIIIIIKREWAWGLDSNVYNVGWLGNFTGLYTSLKGKIEAPCARNQGIQRSGGAAVLILNF